jgi:hypothetical protein
MTLTLRYRGELPANGTPLDKHRIREQLSSQLSAFWAEDSRLKDLYPNLKNLQIPKLSKGHFIVDRPLLSRAHFWWRWPLCGYDFIPLLTHIHEAHCHLEIRLYRKSDDGILYTGGDLDNHLKTFFDALRVPTAAEQVPKQMQRPDDGDWLPIFCLLDDDRAITRLAIESFKLLTPVPESVIHPKLYVELDVDVTIKPITPMQASLEWLF